jgi:hypothetical protein
MVALASILTLVSGCALRDGNGDLVFPQAEPENSESPALQPVQTNTNQSPAPAMTPTTAASEPDPHPEEEGERRKTVERINAFLAQNYLPGFGSTIEYRGSCTVFSGGQLLSLANLNLLLLWNV